MPKVAGWIIGAGGGIGSYGRNVNQTVQRGAQGAYTGSKAMVGEAQVLLPVMSFGVSKGHSLKRRRFPQGFFYLRTILLKNRALPLTDRYIGNDLEMSGVH